MKQPVEPALTTQLIVRMSPKMRMELEREAKAEGRAVSNFARKILSDYLAKAAKGKGAK